MATIRWSINPQDPTHQVVQAVGAAVVTKSIELTVDTGALIAAGITGTHLRMQVLQALQRIEEYIETGSKSGLPA